MLQFSKTLVVIPLIFLYTTHISSGQQIPTDGSPPTGKTAGTSGLPVQRPMVPQQSMRPLTSNRQEFNASRAGAPTSEFIQPVAGTDASIEVIVGQGRLLTMKKPISTESSAGVIAIGDPTILDFDVLTNPKFLRITGKRAGVTDLTIVTGDAEAISFEIHVLYDMDLIRAQLARIFPNAQIQLSQLREHIVLEGQARSTAQIAQIEQTLEYFIATMQAERKVEEQQSVPQNVLPPSGNNNPDGSTKDDAPGTAYPEVGGRPKTEVKYPAGKIINLMVVPGVQQIMLQVRVAELNRTGLRAIGADWLIGSSKGSVLGTSISGNPKETFATAGLAGLLGEGSQSLGSSGTAFGIFPSSDVNVMIRALRENSLLSILAEPNLVALSGHEATFLAGGQFPVPVPQGGAGNQVTIQYKDFGVQLRFVPHLIDDQTVRLEVSPEVSTIDQSLGTTLVQGGLPIPGINTRRVHTTVEMREGETLALAGLLQVTLDAKTSRIPGLGDLPYLGPFFSNTSHNRMEKELLVMVTPVMVSPISDGQALAYPGQDIVDPNDLEFYLLGRIEGRTGRAHRSTTTWDDPLGCIKRMRLEKECIQGPVGLSR